MRGIAGVAVGLTAGLGVGLVVGGPRIDSGHDGSQPDVRARDHGGTVDAARDFSASPSESQPSRQKPLAVSRELDDPGDPEADARIEASKDRPHPTREIEISVVDEEGQSPSSATIVAVHHGESDDRVLRHRWSPAAPRVSLPLGRWSLHAERTNAHRSRVTSVLLSENDASRRVELRLRENARVRGTVRFDGGEPVGVLRVVLRRLPGGDIPGLVESLRAADVKHGTETTLVDPGSGGFEFDQLDPGRYFLQARFQNVPLGDRVVDLHAGTQDVELLLPSVAADRLLRVFVSDSRGRRLGDVWIQASIERDHGSRPSVGVQGDDVRASSDGALPIVMDDEFANALDEPGDHWLTVISPGH
jgi:hypothetical protein